MITNRNKNRNQLVVVKSKRLNILDASSQCINALEPLTSFHSSILLQAIPS